MKSIPYVINKLGEKLYIDKARSGEVKYFYCPECGDGVIARKGMVNAHSFSHSRKIDRTPLERACSYYHDSDAISDSIQKIHIKNGGVPLYLASTGIKNNDGMQKFELIVAFPTLSDSEMKILKENKSTLLINSKAYESSERVMRNVDNLNYYKIDYINKWTEIECHPTTNSKEVKSKWLCGIEGVKIGEDIFHSYKDGGYRVANASDIYLGKEYLMIFEDTPRSIVGIKFNKIGEISFKKCYKAHGIYLVQINEINGDSTDFFMRKGRILVEKASELSPIWPPAVFEGKTLKYDKYSAFFLQYDEKINNNIVNFTDSGEEPKLKESSKYVIQIRTNGSTLATYNEMCKENIVIKHNIIKVNNLITKAIIEPNVVVIDMENRVFDFGNKSKKPPIDGILRIKSNLKYSALRVKNGIVVDINSYRFSNINRRDELVIDLGPFGRQFHSYQKPLEVQNEKINAFNKQLRNCGGICRLSTATDMMLLEIIKNDSTSGDLYKILEPWMKANKIPIQADPVINKLKEIVGVTYGKR